MGKLDAISCRGKGEDEICFLWRRNEVQKYPKARITGLSNSSTQREYILGKAKEKGLSNVEASDLL